MSKTRQNQTTTAPNAELQARIDAYTRQAAGNANQRPPIEGAEFASSLRQGMATGLGGIEQYTNPHEAAVIGGLNTDFDRQRMMASRSAADEATKAGAFGGSRAAVLNANLQGDVNRSQAMTNAGVRQTGFDNATNQLMMERQRQAGIGAGGLSWLDEQQQRRLAGMEAGLGYGGMTSSQPMRNSPLSGALGGAATGAKFGPWGALAGGILGGAGSYL